MWNRWAKGLFFFLSNTSGSLKWTHRIKITVSIFFKGIFQMAVKSKSKKQWLVKCLLKGGWGSLILSDTTLWFRRNGLCWVTATPVPEILKRFVESSTGFTIGLEGGQEIEAPRGHPCATGRWGFLPYTFSQPNAPKEFFGEGKKVYAKWPFFAFLFYLKFSTDKFQILNTAKLISNVVFPLGISNFSFSEHCDCRLLQIAAHIRAVISDVMSVL